MKRLVVRLAIFGVIAAAAAGASQQVDYGNTGASDTTRFNCGPGRTNLRAQDLRYGEECTTPSDPGYVYTVSR